MNQKRQNQLLNEALTRHNNILEYNFGKKNDSLSEQEDDEEFNLDDASDEAESEENNEQTDEEETSDEEESSDEEETSDEFETSEETEDDVTEIDVTDIVNNQEKLEGETEQLNQNVEDVFSKISGLYDKIDQLESSVGNMDKLLDQIHSLEKEVKMVQPLTPEEEKDEMAEKSYPYNTTLEDYEENNKSDNQSDMEEKEKSRLDWKDVMRDYNENQIRNSFNSYVDQEEM